jgi:hypothetical protein
MEIESRTSSAFYTGSVHVSGVIFKKASFDRRFLFCTSPGSFFLKKPFAVSMTNRSWTARDIPGDMSWGFILKPPC